MRLRRQYHRSEPDGITDCSIHLEYLIVVFCCKPILAARRPRPVSSHSDCSFCDAIYIRSPRMEPENELIAQRREKTGNAAEKGVEPFGAAFEISGRLRRSAPNFKTGNVSSRRARHCHRDMGKATLSIIHDLTGRIQVSMFTRKRSVQRRWRSSISSRPGRFRRSPRRLFFDENGPSRR